MFFTKVDAKSRCFHPILQIESGNAGSTQLAVAASYLYQPGACLEDFVLDWIRFYNIDENWFHGHEPSVKGTGLGGVAS